VENQAIDRTHRIGQTSKVMAYRLLMRERSSKKSAESVAETALRRWEEEITSLESQSFI
jgi:SNF2 family DNA or RNA helicase